MNNEAAQTMDRKVQHIDIVANRQTQYRHKTTLFECIEVLPYGGAVKESDVNLGTEYLHKEIEAPIAVSGMTGGHDALFKINRDIADAVSKLGVPMGVGSQRAMIENPRLAYTYDVKRGIGRRNMLLIGNIGASKLAVYEDKRIKEALEAISADAIAVHTNPGQESVQPEGDIDFRGAYERICELARSIDRPVILKEVGNGISKDVAKRFRGRIYAIDVQGAGGTTWIGIETYRSKSKEGLVFWDWGIPTALSTMEVLSVFDGPVIASGGIRSSEDIIKGVALGAQLCSMAEPVLKAELRGGAKGVYDYIKALEDELRSRMAELGFGSIEELRKARVLINEPLAGILRQRKVKLGPRQRRVRGRT
ncbi:MAG: type 2 isopentenyl-diphosphate Delta-isomerase [Candidatus Micrarchaeia archaeon]